MHIHKSTRYFISIKSSPDTDVFGLFKFMLTYLETYVGIHMYLLLLDFGTRIL